MCKKLLVLFMSFALVMQINACGFSIGKNDGNNKTEAITNPSLKVIEKITPVNYYPGNKSMLTMDTVKYGIDEYEEPIEWLVLDKDDNKALLISKYILTTHTFFDVNDSNYVKGVSTWKDSAMRKWLNEEYINTIFSKKEQKSIIESVITTKNSSKNNLKEEYKTNDRLFLISEEEADKYFSSINQGGTETIESAKDEYNYISESDGSYVLRNIRYYEPKGSRWWTEEELDRYLTIYTTQYKEDEDGNDNLYSNLEPWRADEGGNFEIFKGVRPAMWVRYK